MRYIAPLDAIACAMRGAAYSNDDANEILASQILDEAARFAQIKLAPLNAIGDRAGACWRDGFVRTPPGFAEAYRAWTDAGWMGVTAPQIYGGAELPALLSAALDEIWNSANMAFYLAPILNQAAARLVIAHGTAEQKAEFLPPLLSGAWTACMALTEPHAGSDLSVVKTVALREGDGSYRIAGSKVFISYAENDLAENILHLVLARTEASPPGGRGLSLFAVPKVLRDGTRNDLICTGIEHKLGLRGAPTCSMSYGSVEGAKGYLIGTLDKGLSTMFVMMNAARMACALQGVGIAERATQQAKAYAESRLQGHIGSDRTVIGRHPDVMRMLEQMEALTTAARALAYTTAQALEVDPARGSLLTPVAKIFCSEAAFEVASLNIQIHGGLGYIEEAGASQLMRDSRAIAIYEGTNGIQAIDLVMRKLVGDEGALIDQEIFRFQQYAKTLETNNGASDFSIRLVQAIVLLRDCMAWLNRADLTDATRLAVATPFATLMGDVSAAACFANTIGGAAEVQPELVPRLLVLARRFAFSRLARASMLADEIMNAKSTYAA